MYMYMYIGVHDDIVSTKYWGKSHPGLALATMTVLHRMPAWCARTYTHPHTRAHTDTHTHTYANTHAHNHTYTHTHTNTRTRRRAPAHTHTRTHTHAHTHDFLCEYLTEHMYIEKRDRMTHPSRIKKLEMSQTWNFLQKWNIHVKTICVSHVTQMNHSCPTHASDMSHTWILHNAIEWGTDMRHVKPICCALQHIATRCNTLCNMLQHAVQHAATLNEAQV